MEITPAALKKTYALLSPHLDERTRRLWCAAQANALGRGGIARVQEATGVSRPCIVSGQKDLAAPPVSDGRVRRIGGGRKRVAAQDPALLGVLDALVEPTERGEPTHGLRWTCKSTRQLAQELGTKGHRISHTTVAEELHLQKFRFRGNRKSQDGFSRLDCDAQFRHIHGTATGCQQRGEPVISLELNKKQRIGAAQTGESERHPSNVEVHDIIDKTLGHAIPYGVLDAVANEGFVSVGIDEDTASVAVATLRRWWMGVGRAAYPHARHLYITANGSGGAAGRLFQRELQTFADETGLTIAVSHNPPGTSKWNAIDHRMFGRIATNGGAQPDIRHEILIELIAHTTTEPPTRSTQGAGATTDFEPNALAPTEGLGERNYAIAPRVTPLSSQTK